MPWEPRLRISCQVRLRADGSKPVVGSSKAAGESAHPDVALLLEVEQGDHLGSRVRIRIGRRVQLDRLRDREHRLDRRLLGDDPDSLAQGARRALRVDAQHGDRAGVAPAVPLENLEHRRLARAVRAEHGHDLALAHLEVDSAHRLEAAVALVQPADVDDGGQGHPQQLANS